jgi:hypothetical protein
VASLKNQMTASRESRTGLEQKLDAQIRLTQNELAAKMKAEKVQTNAEYQLQKWTERHDAFWKKTLDVMNTFAGIKCAR